MIRLLRFNPRWLGKALWFGLLIGALTLFLMTSVVRQGRAGPLTEPVPANTSAAAAMMAQATPHPAATPAAPGCGNEASSPTEIAEVFLAAATAESLERATRCFAPESQPQAWDEVFLGGDEDAWDDVTGCRGQPYVVTESKIRTGFSAIIFNFDRACAVAQLDPWQRELYDADTLAVTTVVVQTYRAGGRWYVLDAFVSVPD